MTLKQLREYRSICDEITDIKQQLNGSFVGDTVQSASEHPYDKRSVHIEGFPSDGHTLSLLARLSVLERSRKEVEEFIKSIPKYQIRKAIYLYYLAPIGKKNDYDINNNDFVWDEKPSWEDVADKIGNGTTANSLKKASERYLKCHECHTCHK